MCASGLCLVCVWLCLVCVWFKLGLCLVCARRVGVYGELKISRERSECGRFLCFANTGEGKRGKVKKIVQPYIERDRITSSPWSG